MASPSSSSSPRRPERRPGHPRQKSDTPAPAAPAYRRELATGVSGMVAGEKLPIGRERRRKGPVNRIRRFLYGALLLAAAPGASAIEALADVGKYRVAPAAAEQQAALVRVQGLLMLRVNEHQDPDVVLDAVTAQLPRSDAMPQFSIAAVRRDNGRFGADFDLPVDEFGDFHVSLLAERSAVLSAWSLGGTIELARTSGERYAARVPELRVQELHAREIRFLAFETSLARGRAETGPELEFRWRI